MILTRCPNLQTLTLGDPCFSDLESLSRGRWNKLHTLKLTYIPGSPEFSKFLSAHANLRTLGVVAGYGVEPPTRHQLRLMPKLETLVVADWLERDYHHNISSFSHLRHLDIAHEPFVFSAQGLQEIRSTLRSLTSLEWLRVRFAPPNTSVGVSSFGSVLSACPGLTTFELQALIPLTMVRCRTFSLHDNADSQFVAHTLDGVDAVSKAHIRRYLEGIERLG